MARISKKKNNVIEHEMCVRLSAQPTSEKILIPRRTEGDIKKVHSSACKVCVVFAGC
jgi:3'-phosphoadenosine 5'-phosphosulfate (PAPS) 3'-phosphatase